MHLLHTSPSLGHAQCIQPLELSAPHASRLGLGFSTSGSRRRVGAEPRLCPSRAQPRAVSSNADDQSGDNGAEPAQDTPADTPGGGASSSEALGTRQPRRDSAGRDNGSGRPQRKSGGRGNNSRNRSYGSDDGGYLEDGKGEDRLAPGLPSYPRMSADDERLAGMDGHFVRRLQESGLLNAQGGVTALGSRYVEPMQALYLHLILNKMLSMNRRYQTVLAVVRDVGQHMGPVNVATAMHRLGKLVRAAKLSSNDPTLPDTVVASAEYRMLLDRAEALAEDIQPRAVANFLWGMAALHDVQNTRIVQRLGQRLMEVDPRELKTQELSNVVWSLVKLQACMPEVIDRMLDSATERIDECVPQALSNMTWACATIRHHHPAFLTAVAKSAAPRLREFQSQTLANTLWAFSVLGVYPHELFHPAADEVVRRFSSSDRARRASGYFSEADAGSNQQQAGRLDRRRRQSQDAGSGMSSDEDGSPSYNAGRQRARSNADFRGQEISNILIAYARGCIIHQGMLRVLEEELCSPVWSQARGAPVQVPRLQEFSSQALANTLWAFASLRWYPARLLPVMTEAIGGIVHLMTAQELANSLWSYARFAYHPGRVMGAFLAAVERRTADFEGQGCTNTLWALAVLKATHSAAFVELLRRYIQLERAAAIPGELQYNQVLQAVLLAQFEARGGRVAWRPEVDLPEDVVDKALDAWSSQQAVAQLSGFHLDVSEGLKRLGVEHDIEHLVARDLLSIDIAVISAGRRIAIEVDGPFHFPVNARTPLGHTMIRRRLLRAAGWTTVSIPWYDWFTLTTWDERLKYLASCLQKADASFSDKLGTATGELLSTNFTPGPGVVAPQRGLPEPSAMSATGSFDEGDDGPVLSYNEDGTVEASPKQPAGDDLVGTGLLNALTRRQVHFTKGAMRRLQSMGLGNVVQAARERQAAMPSAYAQRAGAIVPPPSGADDASGLLPKPLPRKPRSKPLDPWEDQFIAGSFNPQFMDRVLVPGMQGDTAWGLLPEELEEMEQQPAEQPQQPAPLRPAAPAPAPRRAASIAANVRGMRNNAAAADAVITRVLRGRPLKQEQAPAAQQPSGGREESAADERTSDSEVSPGQGT